MLNSAEKLISVIVPVYNVEKYLVYCLDSILAQTYNNLQIILVDDGSTDSSGKICDEYKLKDVRIQVIHKANGGLSDARNTGMKQAKGEYISFIDSDDYIYPTFYKELVNNLQKYDADISQCQFLRIDIKEVGNFKTIIECENDKIKETIITKNNIEALNELYGPRLFPYVQKVVVWNKIYKKEVLSNIEFPLGKLHEDEYTTHKILYKMNKMVYTNKCLYGYIQTKNSIIRQEIKQKRIDDNLDAYIKSSEFFEKHSEKQIEMQSKRRYLENCIELAGKVLKGNSEYKRSQIIQITNLYKENYYPYIQDIKKFSKDEREIEIINLLENAMDYINKFGTLNEKFWEELEKIINKD